MGKSLLHGATVRGEDDVAGEGKLIGIPKFHSWSKCIMPLTQIRCAMLPLACVLTYLDYTNPSICILGYNLLCSIQCSLLCTICICLPGLSDTCEVAISTM